MARSDSFFFARGHAIECIVWGATPDGRLDYSNTYFSRFVGRTGAASGPSLIGTKVWDWPALIHPDDFARMQQVMAKAMMDHKTFETHCRLKSRTGEVLPFIVRGTTTFWSNGAVHRYLGTAIRSDLPNPGEVSPGESESYVMGMTEEQRRLVDEARAKAAEDGKPSALTPFEAERNAKRLEFLAEASAELSSSLDLQTILQNLMRLGVPRLADWISILELLPGDILIKFAHIHRDPAKYHLGAAVPIKERPSFSPIYGSFYVMRTGQAQMFSPMTDETLMAMCKTQEIADKLRDMGSKCVICAPLIVRGQVLGTVAFSNGVSERLYDESDRLFAQEIANRLALAIDHARLYRESQKLNQAKDEFLAVLSHELRTPLNVIMGHADTLLSERERIAPDDMQVSLDAIWRNSRAQLQIVDDLLNVSQMILGKIDLSLSRFSVRDLVAGCVESLNVMSSSKQMRIHLDTARAPAQITADYARLQQVLMNLLMNSIKYTGNGGEIHVRIETNQPNVEIAIEDNGIGIDPDFLPFVFDRFRQESSSLSRAYGGLGLGLSIVRNLVELHGGSVRAFSEGRGKGSRFTVILPIGPETSSDREQDILKTNMKALESEINGLRVLVVEDDPDTRTLIRRFLERAGAEVFEAGTAAAAFRAFKSCNPDILLSDIDMPEEDGISLIEKIRAEEAESGKSIPALALTAFTRPVDSERTLAAGYQMHLTKPVTRATLLSKVVELARDIKRPF